MSRVVVGIDGSPASNRALRHAVEQARQREESLLVVTAWGPPIVPTPYPIDIDFRVYEAAAEETLDKAISQLPTDAVAEVDLQREVVKADARDALVSRLHADDLLVVGTRGLGGIAGLLLGSVASYCIRHAPCPVLVVPEPDDETDRDTTT
jgi:nucleotide-binding universal stress UspA family protein